MNPQNLACFAQLIASIGIIPGFVGLFYTMEQQRHEQERVGKAMRLAALGAVNDMIEKDRAKQPKIEEVIRFVETLPKSEAELLEDYGTGRGLYYANPNLAEVGRHYEHLGAMVKLGYIDFDLIFEVITFPDDFWDATEPLVRVMRDHWGGPEKPLPDLWINFEYLRERYHEKRAQKREEREKTGT